MRAGKAAGLIAIALLAILPASGHAALPGANGKIAFVKNDDVWTMNPDGSNQIDITNTPTAKENSPAWSADGKRIAYVRDTGNNPFQGSTEIWVMNADGTGQTRIVPAPSDPNMCGGPGFAVLGDSLGGPAWSPDGSKVVFYDFRACRFFDSTESDYSDLYTVAPDGTGKALFHKDGLGPRWSPDGSKIGFTSFCEGGGCTDVRWVTADGSQEFSVYSTNVDNEHFTDWSPDGLLIDGGGEGGFGHPGFYDFTIHPDGTGYHEFPNGVSAGKWSPDGTKFLLGGVYTENTDGSGLTQIASGSAPDWQPITTNYARPKGATPFRVFFVPAYKPCTTANSTHGAPLSFPSCNPPQQTSDFLTVGTTDSNGQGNKSIGVLRMDTVVGNPSTPANEADIALWTSITDVRNKSDLSDYTGSLEERIVWRTTDRNNSPASPATVSDVSFPINLPCATTADATIGSRCALRTTINAIIPNAIEERQREIIELGQVLVYDGGADGNPATGPPGTLFMDQGLFVP